MKKFFIFIFLSCSFLLAQGKYDINVVAIGIGEKNPTFDEGRFPHISFYYTPKLISKAEVGEEGKAAVALFGGAAREVFEGEPEVLAKWWDETDIRNHAIIFDKNGVGAWQGWLKPDRDLIDCEGKGEESSVEDIFEYLLEDNEVIEFDDGKEFDYEDNDCLIETKMVDFMVVTPTGEEKSTKSIVENGKATMVIFFQISKDVDLNAVANVEEDESVGSFLGSIVKTTAGESWEVLFKKIEGEFFEHDVPDKKYEKE